jgi:hypothetical protein
MPSAAMLSLMNKARVRLPGALDSAILQELASTFDEFLTISRVWYEDIDFTVNPTSNSFEEAPGDYTYPLVPTSGGVVSLEYVRDASGNGKPASMPVIPDVIIGITPSASETWTARTILKNNAVDIEGYPVVPDWIVQRYEIRLLDGVLGRMMSQIAKPYTSSATALVHLRLFNSGAQRARTDARRENLYAAQRWSYPQSFNRTR